MNMKTLLALAVSAVCSVGVAQAHEHNHDHNMVKRSNITTTNNVR